MVRFTGQVLQTEEYDRKINYPHELLLYDDENLLGTYNKPMLLIYNEVKRLYDIFKPIVELWEGHNKFIHGKYQNGEITEEEALKLIKREV